MNKVLLIVDVQNAFLDAKWGNRNNPDAERNIKTILTEWRRREFEVIFIQHISEKPDSLFYVDNESCNIQDIIKPVNTERIFTKNVNSAFIGTSLENHLKNKDIKEVVITGLTTPHCVSTTARMSGNLGFKTYVISDATAAFGLTDQTGTYVDADTIHNISLATLHNEFANVLSTNDLLKRI
ncbi:cysteine hydrolase family protein [Bacillus sp. JCM 19034]|uniref:cysteine hydrolase family protein n=1 Tax=Bacillus sp. JCM 19034 TaxID=1481928 RepID=UPI0007842230|nr:cysteine hydrolase family protein [Bacillus sp. JCM 19034]